MAEKRHQRPATRTKGTRAPIRVALYARVSKPRPGLQHPETQLRELRQYARAQGYRIVAEYIDRETGSSATRPAFRELFEAASRRQFDLVLFWRVDRFCREGIGPTFRYLQILQQYGIGFKSLRDVPIDTTGPLGEVILSLLACFAKLELETHRDRVRAGIDRARAAGQQFGRPKVVLDIDRARELAAAGESLSAIARKLSVSKVTVWRRLQEKGRRRRA